ncbi:MAG: transglutaminase family protein [Campylobacterales bacterium]|nr:transglutaminase family protein [Campylobacterales bacterium]
MLYQIYHSTQFTYQQWVSFSHNLVRLKPRNTQSQTLVDFSLSTDPAVTEMETYDDYFGNHLYHMLIRQPHHHLKVTARSCVAMDSEAIDQHLALAQEARLSTYAQVLNVLRANTSDVIDAKQFCLPSRFIAQASRDVHEYALLSFSAEKSLYDSVEEFMGRIFNDFQFVSGFSDLSTPVDEVFRERKGVCQDFSHLAIAALRSLGLSARYMSGYLETLPAEGSEKFFGADASHAWFSVFIPGFGWFDFDPTNNIVPSHQHIVLGYGRDYGDCSPMQGVVQGSGVSHLNVMVDVSRDEA